MNIHGSIGKYKGCYSARPQPFLQNVSERCLKITCTVFPIERLERVGPCRLLKLSQKGTQGVLPWLVRWAVVPVHERFFSALAALVGLVKNILFPHRTLFHFFCPQAGRVAVPRCLSLKCLVFPSPWIFAPWCYLSVLYLWEMTG